MAGNLMEQQNGFEVFDALSESELRQRNTAKWSYYAEDVLRPGLPRWTFPLLRWCERRSTRQSTAVAPDTPRYPSTPVYLLP